MRGRRGEEEMADREEGGGEGRQREGGRGGEGGEQAVGRTDSNFVLLQGGLKKNSQFAVIFFFKPPYLVHI